MNKHQHALMYSMAAAIAVIGYSLAIYLAGITNTAWSYISYVLFTGILVYAIKDWRDKQNAGLLSYGKTMGYSTFFALYYSLVMVIWTYVFFSYIAPGFMESQMLKQEALMEAKGMPPEQIEMGMKYARKFTQPGVAAIMGLVGGMFFYTIINLIVAAIMKKDSALPSDDQQNSSAI
ncbi:MAG: DUF4199 domain-containing protein [Bacteroidetes bacterium]|jgi:hypothetical protein|nr:DUF4199 domain-containing protein [Bacteroidota bacterium]